MAPIAIFDVLERAGAYFMKQSPIHLAARRLAETMADMDIPFAIAGALAANAHGHVRTTEDVDIRKVQALVGCLSENFTALFTGLTKQCKTLEDLRSQLTETRARCINMFHTLWMVNRDVSWLERDVSAPWMDAFLLADSQTSTMKDAEIWNRLSKQKTVIERCIGKEAMFMVLRSLKRAREEGNTKHPHHFHFPDDENI